MPNWRMLWVLIRRVPAPAPQYRRLGELAFQWMLELFVGQAHASQPEALPVIVCLYGDHSGQPIPELEQLLDYLLSTSGFVYGIKDRSTADFASAHVPGNRPRFCIISPSRPAASTSPRIPRTTQTPSAKSSSRCIPAMGSVFIP